MKKICIVTGSRAEYGLLTPLMKKLKEHPDFKLQIIVTGSHLSPKFGFTYKEIEKDGFVINTKIPLNLNTNNAQAISKAMARELEAISSVLSQLSPDLMLILGDRYEIFVAATASVLQNIPIAHIHGGEITLGAIDDIFRHTITKMSSLHFASTEVYRKRIIQMGENPMYVFNVGALGVENIFTMNFLNKTELENTLNIKFYKHILLITFHPVTTQTKINNLRYTNELLAALENLQNTTLIFTKSNADVFGELINEQISNFVVKHNNAYFFDSLGMQKYLSLLKISDAIVGNSSSGILEAPSLGTQTINIGNRQEGRIKTESILDVPPQKEEIRKAVLFVLKSKKKPSFLYGKGNTSEQIIEILSKTDFSNLLPKTFYDLSFTL